MFSFSNGIPLSMLPYNGWRSDAFREQVDERVLDAICAVDPWLDPTDLNQFAIKVTNIANKFLMCAQEAVQAGKNREEISLQGKGILICVKESISSRHLELFQKLVKSLWGFELKVALEDESIEDFFVHRYGATVVEYTNFTIAWPHLQPFSKPEPYKSSESKFAGFQKLREEGFLTDLTIRSQGHEFPVHRLVLAARSEFFKRALQIPMVESTSRVFDINVVDLGADVKHLGEFIDFLYTDKIKLEEREIEDINKLLSLANAYQVEELKEACIYAMSTRLDETNVEQVKKLGEAYHIQALIDLCTWWVDKTSIEKLQKLPGGSSLI